MKKNYTYSNSNDYQFFLKKKSLRYVLKLYQYMGVLVGIIGCLYIVISELKINLGALQMKVLLLTAAGFMIASMSKFFYEYLKEKELDLEKSQQERAIISDFILTLKTFEDYITSYIKEYIKKKKIDPTIDLKSLNAKIDYLHDEHIIGQKELHLLIRTIEIRNLIMHEEVTVPVNLLREYISELDEIIAVVKDCCA